MENFKVWIEDTFTAIRLQGRSRLPQHPPESYLEHNEGKFPVVLIPGITERWPVMKKIGDTISSSGHNVFVVSELGDNLFSIDESVKIVENLIKKNSLNNVVLVTHSKGGLIGKQILLDGRAERMIAISTAFSGANIAKVIPTKGFQELAPGSDVIKRLSVQVEVNNQIVSVVPRYDNYIINAGKLEGAENIVVDTAVGHYKSLEDDDLIRALNEKLSSWDSLFSRK